MSLLSVIFISVIYFVITNASVNVEIRHLKNLGYKSNYANSSKGIRCSHYKQLYPYKKRTNLDKQCKISFTPSSRQYFWYKVTKFNYRFVKFHLQFLNFSSEIDYTKCVIQPNEWIWTFRGVEGNYGGRQYLYWPPEYGTISLGMLNTYTSLPLRMNLTVTGQCGIVIGAKNTTMRLAMAFANFTHDLAMTKDEYNYSYWCYKERIFIQNYFLYKLCLHVICPIETIGYRCCKHVYDVNIHDFTLQCPGNFYSFGGVWWVCPFVIGFVLYLYFALAVFWLMSVIYKHLPITIGKANSDPKTTSPGFENSVKKRYHGYSAIQGSDNCADKCLDSHGGSIWVHHNMITVFSILVYPLHRCCRIHPVLMSRVLRIFIVILSVSIVFLKVCVYYYHNRSYIVESVKQGAPMNFLSMVAGYEQSKNNFLIVLGGPYIAILSYLSCFILLISIPESLSDFLAVGLPEKTINPNFILTVDLKIREFYGSRRILIAANDGFRKIQKTMLADIFCLLNPNFWKYAFKVQIIRFKNIASHIHGTNTLKNCLIALTVLIPYVALCLIEMLLVCLCYGFPTIFAIGLVYRAYCRNIYDWLVRKGTAGYVSMAVVIPGCLILLTFTIYMFSIIFVDSFIFLSRIAIFTYTGLFANPTFTEGYLIFSITVIMYFYDSIHSINENYERLFYQTKKVCKRINKRLRAKGILYRKDVEGGGIPLELFLFIADSYKPKRVEILKSVVKIITISVCLYISIGILTRFDGFQQLSVVTQTATTTFVCLVPKIFARMCSLNERRYILRMRDRVHHHVKDYMICKGIEYKADSNMNGNSETLHSNMNGPSFELL